MSWRKYFKEYGTEAGTKSPVGSTVSHNQEHNTASITHGYQKFMLVCLTDVKDTINMI